MAKFSVWSDIFSIKRLVVTTRTTQLQTFVYGNGINQTEVIIHMNAVNQNNEEITDIPTEIFLKNSMLLDFIRGEVLLDATTVPLDKREAIWSYSRVDNGYNIEPPSPAGIYRNTQSRPLTINAAVTTFFVMCGPNTPDRTLQIAVQVSLTHPKAPRRVYQTSITGTPGFESFITATALDPIDYSRKENIREQEGVSTTERNNINWEFKPRTSPAEPRDDGTRKRHYFRISPVNASQFRRVENLSGTINITDLYSENVTWNGQTEKGFTALYPPNPISVLGFSAQNTPYQVNYWYLNPDFPLIANHYLGQDTSTINPMGSKVSAELTPNDTLVTNDPGMMVCYKFTVQANNQFPFGWSSAERYGMSLKLTDRFGNSGYISLTLDTLNSFDRPRIL